MCGIDEVVFLSVQLCASAVLAMVQCLSVSVTSQSSIELTGEITLVFGMEDSS